MQVQPERALSGEERGGCPMIDLEQFARPRRMYGILRRAWDIALSLLACSGFGEHDTCMVPAAPPAPSCKRSSAVSAFPALAALIWSLPVPY